MNDTHTQSLVSIDFWDTLIYGETGGDTRRNIRRKALQEVAGGYVEYLPESRIEAAEQKASEEFRRVWFNQQRTPVAHDLVKHILDYLEISASQKEMDFLVGRFEDSLMEGPPKLVEGAAEVVPELTTKYKLALISDTMYSPGRIIRDFLTHNRLSDCFDAFLFSDEAGYSKPNTKAYQRMLDATGCVADQSYHIGDRLNTDIKGAKEVGMKGILFTGVSGKSDGLVEEIEPDHVCGSWQEVKRLLLAV